MRIAQVRISVCHPHIFMAQQGLQGAPFDACHGLIAGERVPAVTNPKVLDFRFGASPSERLVKLPLVDRKQ
jgi:hypothetical protein